MPSNQPGWRRAFDAVEGRVAKPVEEAVQTDAFADAVALSFRLRRRLQREVERQTRRALHLVNLPAATDVKRLSAQLAELQQHTRALERRLEEERTRPEPAPARPRTTRSRSRTTTGRSA
jgi:hypothetical protein